MSILEELLDPRSGYAALSNWELHCRSWIFSVLAQPWLAAHAGPVSSWALARGLPIGGPIRKTIFPIFCGGETCEELRSLVQRLARLPMGAAIHLAREDQEGASRQDSLASEIEESIPWLSSHQLPLRYVVAKPSSLGSASMLEAYSKATDDSDWVSYQTRMDRLCAAASQHGIGLMIDAEESWLGAAILRSATELMRRYNRERAVVYHTVQAYRRGALRELQGLIRAARADSYICGIKLVRGAYLEAEWARASGLGQPSAVYESKEATDECFRECLRICFEAKDVLRVFVATHNENSTVEAIEGMERHGIPRDRGDVQFGQLLGMSDPLSHNLARLGYLTAKFVPYGPVEEALPYLVRRSQENSSVLGQLPRDLQAIRRELARRRDEAASRQKRDDP